MNRNRIHRNVLEWTQQFLLLLILVIITVAAQAQNLVPNPSFENYNACPTVAQSATSMNVANATVQNWITPGPTWITPDYLNTCAATGSQLQVPNCRYGYQQPHTGNAFVGIYNIIEPSAQPNRESFECQLLQPMVAGHRYAVGFYVNMANMPTNTSTETIVVTDQIGMLFTNFQVSVAATAVTGYTPSVTNGGTGNYITDTANWVRLQWVYTATGGEQWLTIGNFEYPSTYIISMPRTANTYRNYLFIDDVCVVDIGQNTTRKDTVICNNKPLILRGIAGANNTYLWSTGATAPLISVSTPGTYWVATTGDCMYHIDTFRVTAFTSPLLSLGNDFNICSGSQATISSNNTYTSYQWNTGATTSSISVSQAGQYILTVKDQCVQSDTINIGVIVTPKPLINDTEICINTPNPTIHVTGTNIMWYQQPNGTPSATQPVINTAIPGVYTYYVTQKIGQCISEQQEVHVKVVPQPKADLPADTVLCYGGSLQIGTATFGYKYAWSTGDTTAQITVNHPDNYKLEVYNACGSAEDSMQVSYMDKVPGPTVNDTGICQNVNDPVLHVAGAGLKWYEQPGSVAASKQPTIDTRKIGNKVVYVSQSIGNCESDLKPINIHISVAPVAKLRTDTALCKGEELQIGTADIEGVNYKWSTGATNCCISVTETDTYIIEASNGCGKVYDSVAIYFANCQQCLWAPDAFTPNADGHNDRYRLQVLCPMSEYRLVIADRWGNVMFDSIDPNSSWDGTYKGEPAPVATYFYMVEALSAMPGATRIFFKGDITLIR